MGFHLLIFFTLLSSVMRSSWPGQFNLFFLINPIVCCSFSMSLISCLSQPQKILIILISSIYRRVAGYSGTTTRSPNSLKFTVHSATSVDTKTVEQMSINNPQTTNSRTHPPTRSLTATTQPALTLSDPTSDLVRQYDFPGPLRCRKTSDTVFVAFVRPLSEPVRRFFSCSTEFSQQMAQVVFFLFLHVFLF
jgi:hypothetical protein